MLFSENISSQQQLMENLQENNNVNEEEAPIAGEQTYQHFYVSNEKHGSDYFAPNEQVTTIIDNSFFCKLIFVCNALK